MNRIYKTLWSVSTQSWQAVPETAKASGKKSSSSAVGVVASVALSLSLSGGANAQSPPAINQLPTGGTVARGTATISQTATAQAAAMTVNQSSQRAVINWNTFNLGQSASINFVQPNAQAVTLNRVNDSNPSQIFGRMTANGQVFLSNANGVYFSPTSSVDVGALTATTHSISDDNFMSGKYVFERNGTAGKVINEGNITAALGGYVALLAPEVQNSGVVVARAGTVALAAGEMITLTIDGTGSLAGITTTPSTIATLVENKHAVMAPDGQIILSAVALDKLQSGVIKNSGNLEANSISNKGGKIYLEGDDITLSSTSKLEAKGATGGGTVLVGGDWQGSGTLHQATKVTMEAGATIDASATDKGDGGKVVLWSDVHNANSQTQVAGTIQAEGKGEGTRGGQIETSGARLRVADSTTIRVGGVGTTGGLWLLDPNDYTISSSDGDISGATLSGNITAGTTVEVLSGSGAHGTAGNININDNLSWSNDGILKLTAVGGVTGYGGIAMTNGGTVIFNHTTSGITTNYSGIVSGNGKVTKQGAGGLTFLNAQTYTGDTTITLGGLEFDGAIASGNISLNTGSVIFYTANSGSRTVASNISGSGSVSLSGFLSTYTFTGNNTYSGNTRFENTSLVLGSSNALGTGSITLQGITGLTYTAQNTADYSGQIGTGINNNSILTVDTGGQNVTWASTVFNSNLAGSALIKKGAGTFVLTSGARLDGNTTAPGTPAIAVKAGALVLGGANTLGANFPYGGSRGGGIVIDAGATLQVGNGSTSGDLGGADGVGATQVSNNGTLTFNRTDTYSGTSLQISNNIAGTGAVIMAGTGDVTLSSSRNSYTGGTLLQAGYLIPSVNNNTPGPGYGPSLGLNGAISFEGGGLKYLTETDTNDYSSRFSTAANQAYKINIASSSLSKTWASALTSSGGTLTVSGVPAVSGPPSSLAAGGKLILAGDNTYSGVTTVSGASLQLGNGGTTGSVAGNIFLERISNSYITPTLTVNHSGNFTLGNTVSNSSTSATASNFIVNMANDTDVVTLNATNRFGSIQLTKGTLGLGSASAIGTTGSIYFAGGRLQYSASNTVDYSNRFSIFGSGNPFAIDTNGQSVTLALAGLPDSYPNTPLKKYGTGTLILGRNATYTGGTYVYGGTLQVGTGSTGGAWTTNAAYVASGASLVFKPSSSATISTSVSQDGTSGTSGTVSFVQAASGDVTTYSGNLSNAVSLLEAGPGKLVLTGSASSTGTTTINAGGTLQVGNATATGVLNTGDITNNGTLIYNRTDAKTIAAKISGTGDLVKQGALALTLTGANDYTGNTTLTAGTLALGSASALGTGGTISFGGGTLQYSASNSVDYSGRFSTAANQTYSLDTNGQSVTLGSALSSSGGTLTKLGAGTLTLAAANSYTGATTVNAGTLAVTNAAGLGTTAGNTTVANGSTLDFQGVAVGNEAIFLNGGSTLATSSGTSSLSGTVTMGAASTVNVGGTSLTLSGIVSGAYALTKSGSGTLVLAAANDYGSTTLSAGTLRLANDTALGVTSTGITVPAGTTLELGAIDGVTNLNVTGKTITLASSGTYEGGGYLHNVAGANTWSGAITLQNNSTVTVDTGTSLNLTSASSTAASGAVVSLKPSNGNLNFGTVTGSGGAGYFSSGTGGLTGTFVGFTTKTLVYARPIDANNLNSSYYGSTPSLTLGFFSASSGGTQYNLVSGDYTGAIVYSGAPTATSIPGSYSISYSSGVSISNASYYLAGTGASLTWTVNAKPLTITGVTAQNKTFDGNSTARLAGTPQAAWLTGDVVSLDASAVVAQFASAAVGTAIPVTVTGYALTGASAGNYSLIQPTGLTADILAAASTNVPPVVPPIILPPAPVTPPSVPPGTSPISKEVLPTPPVAEVDSNEPQTTNERTNNKNANSAVLAAAASVAQAVTARPQTVGIPTGAPAGSQASVQVLLVKPASVQTEGLVNVRVSADLLSSANNLVIPLADHLDWRQLQANDVVSVRLANGMSLPDWVQYEAPQKALVAKAIPLNALPLQVMVEIGDRRYLVDIREADLNKVGMQ